jgi:hypothetical protein
MFELVGGELLNSPPLGNARDKGPNYRRIERRKIDVYKNAQILYTLTKIND